MKSLILKDIYNISHNAKQLLFTLIFIAICMLPTSSAGGLGVMVTIICSMMTITTFSMDERSNWTKYALIMPITRKDYIKSKYLVNVIFTAFGMVVGSLIGMIGIMIKGSGNLVDDVLTAVVSCGVGFLMGNIYGSMFIPLIIKWGSEKARMISVVAIAIPSVILFGIYKLFAALGIKLSGISIIIMVIAIVSIIVLINIGSFMISVKWLKEKEF